MHGVRDETEICFSQAIPIDELFEGIEVWGTRVEGVEQIFARRKRCRGAMCRDI